MDNLWVESLRRKNKASKKKSELRNKRGDVSTDNRSTKDHERLP